MLFKSLKPAVLIRIDDIAENMNWEIMNKCENLFLKYNIKPILGVVPNNKDPIFLNFPKENNFWRRIKNWQNNGWEISMHGYSHIYENETFKKDFFSIGGKSEFFGKNLEEQTSKIKKGLSIFKENKIKVRSFFAPNHTYDKNTFLALKNCGINQVIDGYGIKPYYEMDIKFIPQLFYKLVILPFGVQCTQIHLNDWNENNFNEFKKFIEKNKNLIVTYDFVLKNFTAGFFVKILNKLIKVFLINFRKF
tara:strand:+ start:1300 stop:2046 length:747 start_codon:yes stop_codon:yes gene_type:complete